MKVLLNSEPPREEVILVCEQHIIDAGTPVPRELEVRTKDGNYSTSIRTPTSNQAFL